MKDKKNRICGLVIIIMTMFIVLWGFLFCKINFKYPSAIREEVNQKEILESEDMEFEVTDSKFYDYKSLTEKYSEIKEIEEYSDFSQLYEQTFVLVDLRVKNNGDLKKCINLYEFVLGNLTTSNGCDIGLFEALNNDISLLTPELESGQEINVTLTFSYLDRYFGKDFNKNNLELIISLYPIRKSIKL